MVVYIELAFLENFCLDFLLLLLTVFALRYNPPLWRILLAAAVGAAFAIVYPLLSLPSPLLEILKLAVGGLLPLVAVGKRKWGLGVALFLAFTFAFGGALLGLPSLPAWVRFPLFILLAALALLLAVKLYRRRERFQYYYDCSVEVGARTVEARGFLDSGNFALHKGLPVCFLSADILYELMGEILLFNREKRGQVCDEMQIFTQAGAKNIPLYRGFIRVKGVEAEKKEVYFAPLTNRIGREYKILLHSRLGL